MKRRDFFKNAGIGVGGLFVLPSFKRPKARDINQPNDYFNVNISYDIKPRGDSFTDAYNPYRGIYKKGDIMGIHCGGLAVRDILPRDIIVIPARYIDKDHDVELRVKNIFNGRSIETTVLESFEVTEIIPTGHPLVVRKRKEII